MLLHRFEDQLRPARLIRRYKRFLADVETDDGEHMTVHCPNPGAMLGLDAPDSPVMMTPASKAAKLPYKLQLIKADGVWVGLDTGLPNRLAEAAIRAGAAAELGAYETIRREVRYGARNSRVDLLLQDADGEPTCYVEVKNVHLRRDGDLAEFPDCVTARGAKHLAELADLADEGVGAAMLYIIQREDCRRLRMAADLDPTYAAAFADARARGVRALALVCSLSPTGVALVGPAAIEA